MRSTRFSLKRSILVGTFLSLSLFSTAVLAQGGGDDSPATTATGGDNTAKPTATAGNTRDAATTRVAGAKDATDATGEAGATTAQATPTDDAQTAATDDAETTPTEKLPGLSTAATEAEETETGSGPPKLTQTRADTSIPTYPAPTVPPTRNAPFMQQSSLPEGTVFIAVGAILGFFGLLILVWRAVLSCLLHRSVERAAMDQHAANDKAAFPAPPAPFYKYTDRDASSPSLATGTPGRGVRRTTRGATPSANPSVSNLFFSPTAPGPATPSGGAVATSGPGGAGGDRNSRFLPSGFYAAGSGNNPSHANSISMSNLRPDSRGHSRIFQTTPPESPYMAPARTSPNHNMSASSLNLHNMTRPPSQRAPSTYLDDLLDERPDMLPPQGMSPGQGTQRRDFSSGNQGGRM